MTESSGCRLCKCNLLHEDPDYLTSCVRRESSEALKQLFTILCRKSVKIQDQYGRNALHIAVSCGKYDFADWLVNEFKMDLGVKDHMSGWNGLHRSLYFGNIHCAILLMQNGLDFSSKDKEGMSPLKLVLLDSLKAKSFEKRKITLGKVILPYYASNSDELSIEIDDQIDILKAYHSTGWALGRKIDSGIKGKFPLSFVEVVENKEADISDDNVLAKDYLSDVYMWGNNSNFTLGQADAKSRENPDLLETLHLQKCSIKQVAVSKYHSVFLCEDGSVYTCGQGRGGRLGHGNEQTVLCPQKVKALHGVICTAISTAHDHTLVLDNMGQVYSFGVNTYHQLGHHPAPAYCLMPKMIYHKSLKGKIILGIAAARFHSAIYTRQELFTFGLNAGQLGFQQGCDLQTVPRLVSILFKKDLSIKHVSASDGATCCIMNNGDVYVLQDYTCKRIVTRMRDITKLVMSGGILDTRLLVDVHNKDPDPLCVAVMKNDGTVHCWKQGYHNFKECYWAGRNRDSWQVVDVCLGRHLLIATDEGTVFQGIFRNSSASITSGMGSRPANKLPSKASNSMKEAAEKAKRKQIDQHSLKALEEEAKRKREEQEEVMLQRVPLLFRASGVACDAKCRTFAAIQRDPWIGLRDFPAVRAGSIEKDLENLLDEADCYDNIHDAVVKIKSSVIPIHRFAFGSRSPDEISGNISFDFDPCLDKYVLGLKTMDHESVKHWLRDVYTGKTTPELRTIKVMNNSHNTPDHRINHNGNCVDNTVIMSAKTNGVEFNGKHSLVDDDLLDAMKHFSLRDLENPDFEESRTICDEDGVLMEKMKQKSSRRHSNKQGKNQEKNVTDTNKSKPRESVAKELPKGYPLWSHNREMSDIVIESEDETRFHCHKCILYARLDYFRGMLGNPWMEATWPSGAIRMPIPAKILKIVLDYLYTDEVHTLKDCVDVEFLCDILVCADQLLIARLKEMCESSLFKLLSLKNAMQLLEFSCTYNAEQLLKFCCEFVSLNLAYYLEMRVLEHLSIEALTELSKVYKELIPSMAYRKMHSYESWTSSNGEVDAMEIVANYHLLEPGAPVNIREMHEIGNEADSMTDHREETSPRERAELSAKKKRRRRRTSSAKERSISEDNIVVELMNGKPDLISEDLNGQLDVKTPANLEKPQEMEGPSSSATSVSSPNAKSLRDIMEEELRREKNQSTTQRSKGGVISESRQRDERSINPGIRWDSSKKKSQRQRKQESQSNSNLHENSFSNKETEMTVSKQPYCPWAKTTSEQSPVKSFKDVMVEETRRKNESTRNDVNIQSDKQIQKGARKKLSWREMNSNPESSTKSNESTWNRQTSITDSSASSVSFSAIVESQLEEKETSAKILKKPLTLIQIEEKAIEDLLLYYNAKDNPTEYITVERVETVVTTPIWNIEEKR